MAIPTELESALLKIREHAVKKVAPREGMRAVNRGIYLSHIETVALYYFLDGIRLLKQKEQEVGGNVEQAWELEARAAAQDRDEYRKQLDQIKAVLSPLFDAKGQVDCSCGQARRGLKRAWGILKEN